MKKVMVLKKKKTGFSKVSTNLRTKVILDTQPVVEDGKHFDLVCSFKPDRFRAEHGMTIEPVLGVNAHGERCIDHVWLNRPSLHLKNGKPCGVGSVELTILASISEETFEEIEENQERARRTKLLFDFDFEEVENIHNTSEDENEDEPVPESRDAKESAIQAMADDVAAMLQKMGIKL